MSADLSLTTPPPADWQPAFGAAIEMRITYLDMTEKPDQNRFLASPPVSHALLKAEQPPLPFYRWLYHETGRLWHWVDRKRRSDADLTALVNDPDLHIYVLYLRGAPAGFFELDARTSGTVELALFGLMPHAIGHKVGPWLLNQAIERAWVLGPHKVTINTCTLDHPKALPLYQRFGFTPCGFTDKVCWPLSPERSARP